MRRSTARWTGWGLVGPSHDQLACQKRDARWPPPSAAHLIGLKWRGISTKWTVPPFGPRGPGPQGRRPPWGYPTADGSGPLDCGCWLKLHVVPRPGERLLRKDRERQSPTRKTREAAARSGGRHHWRRRATMLRAAAVSCARSPAKVVCGWVGANRGDSSGASGRLEKYAANYQAANIQSG